MNTCKNINNTEKDKEQWLQKYSSRILQLWSQWQSSLGIASSYMVQIKTELAGYYDNPLKRMFIESTY